MFLKSGLKYILASALLFNADIQAQVRPLNPDQTLDSALAPDKLAGNYAWVRQGALDPQKYLVDQAREIPEFKKHQDNGIIAGILYNPSLETIKACIKQSIGNRVPDQKTIDDMVSAEVFRLSSVPDRSIATVVPCRYELIGSGVPGTIIVFKELLNDRSYVRNDVDVRIALVHEGQHILDHYQGWDFGGQRVTSANFATLGFSKDFLYAVMELDAYGSCVSFASAMTAKGEFLPSWRYTQSNLTQLNKYVAEVKKSAKSPAEIQAREYLLKMWKLK